ncbi:cytochrome P450 [Archangium gephyra]|uniref:cytochrome P450 n=1 Tax=Archangium gephyra TaxID=48 RepID=UPI0035D4AA18
MSLPPQLDETLRIHPPIYSIVRKVVADDVVRGFQVRGGTSLYLSPYATHRLPEFWPDPERFGVGHDLVESEPEQGRARERARGAEPRGDGDDAGGTGHGSREERVVGLTPAATRC